MLKQLKNGFLCAEPIAIFSLRDYTKVHWNIMFNY